MTTGVGTPPFYYSSSPSSSYYPNDNPPINFPTFPQPQPPPPSMDPTAVDFRAFYPYTPNEVKHRKRTTSDQLKVLESVFKSDTKPNAARRNDLAHQLDMTPRGVQVWFQNRRAKEKTKKGKAAKAADRTTDSASPDPSPSPSEGDSSAEIPFPPSPQMHVFADSMAGSKSWQPSPMTPDALFSPDPSLLRRGSLPIDYRTLPSHLDPFRRLSVDARLGGVSRSRFTGARSQSTRLAGSPYARAPSLGAFQYSDGAVAGPYNHQAPDNHLYALSTRMVASPIPGPLPSPGFSFGIANTSMPSSPDPVRPYPFQGDDSEDDRTSYDALSRFGSIASIATSDTSNGSVYYSDCPTDHEIPSTISRRGSCNSNQFLGLMSNLDVNGMQPAEIHRVDHFPPDADPGQPVNVDGTNATSAYASPSSTVSSGSASNEKLSVSHPSALSFALQRAADHPASQTSYANTEQHVPPQSSSSEPQFMYVPDSAYPQSVVSADNHHPMNVPDNFHYDTSDAYYPAVYTTQGSYAHGSDGQYAQSYGSYGGSLPLENAVQTTPDFSVSYS